MKKKILDVKNLHVHYKTDYHTVKALNGVNLTMHEGETLGLVGETGAGKTTIAMSIMQLIPTPPGKVVDGEINFYEENLVEVTERRKRQLRGNEISMIFQDPMTAINPRLIIEEQIAEGIKFHKNITQSEAIKQAREMLEIVGIPAYRGKDYAHQFSGGMRQRVIIAMALACNPKLLIADEPTTALDVTIQAQVLQMMKSLKDKYQTSLLMITHDLGIVAETCDRVAIIYAGEIVEYGDLKSVFNSTKHPYTKGLFDSIPSLIEKKRRLSPIEGETPDPVNLPSGCKFHPRCPHRKDICSKESPAARGEEHQFRCHFPLNS